MKVFVTGATGCLGRALVHQLEMEKRQAYALVRPQSLTKTVVPSVVPSTVQFVTGDTLDLQGLLKLNLQVDVVIHAAARTTFSRSKGQADLFEDNVESTKNMAKFAQDAGASHFIFVSSCSVLGDFFTGSRDETATFAPESAYASSKVRCEQFLTAWAKDTGIKLTIVRPPLIYGAYDRGAMKMMIQMIAKRRFVILGDGQNQKSLVNVKTLSQFILTAAGNQKAYGETFIVTDGSPYTLNQICGAIGKQTSSNGWIPHVPLIVCRVISGALRIQEKIVTLGVTAHDIDKFTSSNTYSSAKGEQVLGFKPRATLAEGIQDELQSL